MGRAAEQANTALPKGGGRHLHPLKLAKKDLITLAKCLPDGTGLLPSPQRQPSSSEQTMCSNSRSVTPRSRDPEPSFATAWSTPSRTPRCLPTSSPNVSTRPSFSSAPRASAAPKPLVADHATLLLAFLFGERIFFSLKLCASFLTFCLKSLLPYITSTCSA